ncbi:MAG: MerR family transcriptional regulator, partial [Burkholderiales bacterium]|nr:MerR family transcriptional regulator [Burkholderiales bacterium]
MATLRIWEQRYRAVHPVTAPSGHRLYSPADVQRVLLLRQLTEQGHAIGSIAALDSAQLQQVSEQAALASDAKMPGAGHGPTRAGAALRLVVVGPALAARLQRPEGRVVCLAGDGSIMMNLQELQTIAQH